MPGTLFVVATPIGNLEDLSFRALRTLKEVDLIAAEDTRRTSKLLAHYGIRKTLVSVHEHNERRVAPRLVEQLQAGQSIALVSDAGTPGISDPGQYLVRTARQAGLKVSPIPGPSAIMAALSASGEPAEEFVFMGFPPRSGAARAEWLKQLDAEARTVVLFEAPHRITRTLTDMAQILVNKPIYVNRELTKVNEELVIHTKHGDDESTRALGEFVVVVGQTTVNKDNDGNDSTLMSTAITMFDCLTNNDVFADDKALALVAGACSLEPSAIRKAVKKARILKKRQAEGLS